MSRPRALWWIGAGGLAGHVARSAERAGLLILATDTTGVATGAPRAARVFAIDGADAEAQARAAKEASAEFEIVEAWCGAEFGALSVDRVRRALGLARHEAGAVARALDKSTMLEALRSAGLAIPRGKICEGVAELELILTRSDRPLAVKPALGSGSRGVERVEPEEGVDAADLWERTTRPVGGRGPLVVEPWIDGRSIDANGLFFEGRYIPAGTLEKFPGPVPHALPLAGLDPAPLKASVEKEVHRALEAGGRALGLVHGPVKGDFLVEGNQVVTLEIAPRLHGDVTTSNTLPFGSGLDPVGAWFRAAVESRFDEAWMNTGRQGVATWRVIALPVGDVWRWGATRPLPEGVTLAWHNPKLGLEVNPYADTRTIPGYVAAHGASLEEAEARLREYFATAGYRLSPSDKETWTERVAATLVEAGLDPRASGLDLT